MFSTKPETPQSLNGWGEGHTNRLIKSIFSSNHYQLDKPEYFNFEEDIIDPLFIKNCTKDCLQNPTLALKKLANLCGTTPNKLLLIETHKVIHARKAHTYFRFHHQYTNDHRTEFCRFVRAELPIRNPWASESPGIFYQITIEKTAVKTGCSKVEAQSKVDNLLACLFNNYDFIFDLANSRVYKRKLCINLEKALANLRHLDSVVIFSEKELRSALLDQAPHIYPPLKLNPHTTAIEFYDHTRKKFTRLSENAIECNGFKHLPYAAEHNYIIVRLKYAKCSATFLINMPMFERRYLLNNDTPIDAVVPFIGLNQDAERLKEYYIGFSNGRIVGTPVANLYKPRVNKKAQP